MNKHKPSAAFLPLVVSFAVQLPLSISTPHTRLVAIAPFVAAVGSSQSNENRAHGAPHDATRKAPRCGRCPRPDPCTAPAGSAAGPDAAGSGGAFGSEREGGGGGSGGVDSVTGCSIDHGAGGRGGEVGVGERDHFAAKVRKDCSMGGGGGGSWDGHPSQAAQRRSLFLVQSSRLILDVSLAGEWHTTAVRGTGVFQVWAGGLAWEC